MVDEGTAPIAYQWRKSGATIHGATASLFGVTTATSGDAGTYSVVVSNSVGSVVSSNAVLTVRPRPVPTDCGTNLLMNGSFEKPGSPDGYVDVPGGSSRSSGWTTLANGVEDYNPRAYRFGVVDGRAVHGERVVDLTPFGRNDGGLAQTFPTVAGQRYRVSFYTSTLERSGRVGTGSLTVTAPGVTQTFHAENHTPLHVWALRSLEFVAAPDSTNSTLSFMTLDDSERHFAMIDDVQVTLLGNCPTNRIELVCPEDLRLPCASLNGTLVEYSVHATNRCHPDDLTLRCDPPSGSLFQRGRTTVRCEAVGSGLMPRGGLCRVDAPDPCRCWAHASSHAA